MNNVAPKLQKCWTHKIAFKIIPKMLKQPNFFYSQPSILPKEELAKSYFSTTFGLRFMISSVVPTRSSTSYAYLRTKTETVTLTVIKSVHFGHVLSLLFAPVNARVQVKALYLSYQAIAILEQLHTFAK